MEKDGVTNFANAKKMPLRCVENISVFYKNPPIYNPQGLIEVNKTKKNGASVGGETVRGDVEKSEGKGQLRTKGHEYIQQFTNYPTQFIEFKRDKQKIHPTQKPVELLEYLIKTYTNDGETVLDNCMGSGSTGVACIHTNRNFIGMELDENYFNIAKERIESEINNIPYVKNDIHTDIKNEKVNLF